MIHIILITLIIVPLLNMIIPVCYLVGGFEHFYFSIYLEQSSPTD